MASSAPASSTSASAGPPAPHGGSPEGNAALADAAAPAVTGLQIGGDPVLHRLKEVSEANSAKDAAIEKLQKELQHKEERLKLLSADKRKEMEEFMANVVDTWLGSLTEVTDQHKASFRSGMKALAEEADARNPAWEIVCNASKHHQSNVQRIEQLVTENTQKDELIKELRGFRDEATRIGGPTKRPRVENEPPPPTTSSSYYGGGGMQSSSPAAWQAGSAGEGGGSGGRFDAWDSWQSMMAQETRSTYH